MLGKDKSFIAYLGVLKGPAKHQVGAGSSGTIPAMGNLLMGNSPGGGRLAHHRPPGDLLCPRRSLGRCGGFF